MSLLICCTLLMTAPTSTSPTQASQEPARVTQARLHVQEDLAEHFGKAVFLRIFKEERLLELWLQDEDGDWECFRTYPIAGMSGTLGPKTKQGDKQAPEGFYHATAKSLNPHSKYHLAFNVGYPNSYDRAKGRTGGEIMVHGNNKSAGCFAMTDEKIEEIYTLVNEAFRAGVAEIPIQIYPFAMTPERMEQETANPHYAFWQLLLPGYRYTEEKEAPFPRALFEESCGNEQKKACTEAEDSL